jgi:serine/threonine protein kinase
MESSQAKLLNNRYQKVKRLGEGAYGAVYLAVDMKPEGVKRKADPKALDMLKDVRDPKEDEKME